MLDKLDEAPISPVYLQTEPNASIDLGLTPVEFTLDGTLYREDARVQMRFLPDKRLLFTIQPDTPLSFGTVGYSLVEQGSMTLSLVDYGGQSFDGYCISAHGGASVLVSQSSVVTATPPSNDISTAIYHLFNFPRFLGPDDYVLVDGEPPRLHSKRCGRISLTADGWRITIAAIDETDGLDNALKAEGGYVITHMGKGEREDGAPFSSEQLADLLSCLYYFLSFALGRWAGVALPIGVNQNGENVFEQWGVPHVDPNHWNRSFSWFDEHHPELLPEVFPGFVARWNDEVWAKALKTAIYWYLTANYGGTVVHLDAGIILAQTALERLAWTYCVEDRKMVSESAFLPRGLSASDQVRLLASTLGIPAEIPPSMKALNARRGSKWVDIPDAITSIRNTLVHPGKNDPLPERSYYEAWQLTMWLLDLALLHLCGHSGQYADRLSSRWVGDVSDVPWANCTV